MNDGRSREASALLRQALDIALENDLPMTALRAYANTSVLVSSMDRYEEAEAIQRAGIAYAERFGTRGFTWFHQSHLQATMWITGRWDDAMGIWEDIPDPVEVAEAETAKQIAAQITMWILAHRGQADAALALAPLLDTLAGSTDVQDRALERSVRAFATRTRGDLPGAVALLDEALAYVPGLGLGHATIRSAILEAFDAAIAARALSKIEELQLILDRAGPGNLSSLLKAFGLRGAAAVSIGRGLDAGDIQRAFSSAVAILQERGVPFWRAVTQLEWAEWLGGQGRQAEASPLLEEARSVFERLGAKPWLERAEAAAPLSEPSAVS